jgi:hypothetical protein
MHVQNPEVPDEGVSGGTADALASARALLAQDQSNRLEACAAELQEVLRRHGMRLDVIPARIALVEDKDAASR